MPPIFLFFRLLILPVLIIGALTVIYYEKKYYYGSAVLSGLFAILIAALLEVIYQFGRYLHQIAQQTKSSMTKGAEGPDES